MLVVGGAAWIYAYDLLAGAIAIAAGIGLFAWRRTKPRRLLVLDLGSRRLVMTVEAESAAFARTLVKRINQAIESGEVPSSPPSLP